MCLIIRIKEIIVLFIVVSRVKFKSPVNLSKFNKGSLRHFVCHVVFSCDLVFSSERIVLKFQVEILRRKMEGLSKGILLQRMEEEYNSLLSSATCSLASSASTSKRIELQDSSSMRVLQRVYS